MALLMVLTSIVVLTTVVVEFAYETRVDATLAANARDELRAHYMARSAVNLSRLVLHFQNQFDTQGQQLMQQLAAVAGPEMAGSMPKIRLWELIPVDSGAINLFVGMTAAPPADDRPEQAANLQRFGSYEGGFSASIEDEESKLNLNKLNNPGTRGAIAGQQLMLMWQDPRWDFLFNEENRWRERYNREEILVHLKDWIDEDEVGTALDRVTGTMTQGFSDEVGPYTRYRPSYKPKNALFDTVDEAYLVAGIGDRFMAAFGNRLTVYPDINSKLNINTSDPVQQYMNILAAAENPDMPALRDPTVIQSVIQELEMARMFGGFLGLTVRQFTTVLMAAGIPVRPEIQHNPQGNDFLGDTSQTFRIQGVGQVGDVTRRITAVVRYDRELGKLLYWRED